MHSFFLLLVFFFFLMNNINFNEFNCKEKKQKTKCILLPFYVKIVHGFTKLRAQFKQNKHP